MEAAMFLPKPWKDKKQHTKHFSAEFLWSSFDVQTILTNKKTNKDVYAETTIV